MSQILQKLRDVDPSDSDAVKEAITTFIQNLLRHAKINCNIWLHALEDVITRFPRFCSQHRPTIEKFLANFLDSSNYYDVIKVAKCAHILQQIRPSQDKTATPKNCWREQMYILYNAAHVLINSIFSHSANIYTYNKIVKEKEPQLLANKPLTLALSRISNTKGSGEDKKTLLRNRLRNVLVFIQAMLVEVYPVPKPVQPELIVEVIVLALSSSGNVNTDVADAASAKTEALKTLDALILCLGPNLIPMSAVIFMCVMQTLKWSLENPGEESRKVRCVTYRTANRWLSTLHVHRMDGDSVRSWEDELTKHILDDITPVRKIVQLTMSTQHLKNLSKKAKRRLANTMLQQSTISTHMPGEKKKTDMSEETSDEVANAALECAETFLTVSGIFLKPTTHKMFQERLVRECYSLDSYSSERSIRLLRTLDAARKNTPSTVPPPTQYCVQLYSMLVNSRDDEIRKFCSQALLDIRLHLHCSPPSLNFTLDATSGEKKNKNKRKEVSKKNIAALESLLGKNRMPPGVYDNQDSTGEPLNKRSRLEENVGDRISISSESEDSVVISDDSGDEVQEVIENRGKEADDDVIQVLPVQEINRDHNIIASVTSEQPMNVTTEIVADKGIAVESTETELDDTQIETKIPKLVDDIHDAKTQIPLNTSIDTEDDDSPVSLEVGYDLPNTGSKVTVLEKIDDENLPSTNDTDDVQITCGQIVLSPQEADSTKNNIEVEIEISTVESNENNELNDEIVENEASKETEKETTENIELKITSQEVTVEDMLADFVDEVNEEPSLVV